MEEPDVQPESSQAPEEVVVEEVITTSPAQAPKGSQTDPAQLYAALAEERRLRKEAEAKLNSIPQTPTPTVEEVFSDEGRLLASQISELNLKFKQIEEEKELGRVYAEYPVLKESGSDFDTFRADYPDYKIEDVAKLFIMEKGLAETKPRKGLVKPSGGGQTAPTGGYTAQELAELRKNDHRKYMEIIKADKVDFSELK